MLMRFCILLLTWTCYLTAAAIFCAAASREATLYFYTAENCPHCQEYRPLLMQLVEPYPEVEVVEVDIWRDKEGFQTLLELLKRHGDLPLTTPTVFLGEHVWVGLDGVRLKEIEHEIGECLAHGCVDAQQVLHAPEAMVPDEVVSVPEEEETIALPLLGELDARDASLPLLTLVLGLLDSVNPCAFFVLLFLLSLMIHAHSRARMLTVGLVFVLFSGLIYFLFMAAWLNLFLATGGVAVLTTVAGVVALTIGVVNIKDYFLLHHGPSLSIPEKVKPGLYQRVRNLVQAAGYPSLLGGTAMLAIAANSYELLCTAGFPMVYTRVLTLNELTAWQYYGYLAAYNLVYISPLVLIVTLFAVTLGAHHLSEQQGRVLKLASGVMIAELGAVLLFVPHLLNNLMSTVVLFLSAFIIIALILGINTWLTHHRHHKESWHH